MNLFSVPEFTSSDLWALRLDRRFLLATRLWNPQWLLSYSEGVRLAARMLSNPDEQVKFVKVCTILAYPEILKWKSPRIHPIRWQDIGELDKLLRGLEAQAWREYTQLQ